MELLGKNLIGGWGSSTGSTTFSGIDPVTSEPLSPAYYEATADEANYALELAQKAFEPLRAMPAENIAVFLEAIAEEIVTLGDELIKRTQAETALPKAR